MIWIIDLPVFKNNINVETKIGNVTVGSLIHANDLTEDRISLKAIKFKPKLPARMNVQSCLAILLTIDGIAEIQCLQLTLSIATKALGSPCTGQFLDAQEWCDQGTLSA